MKFKINSQALVRFLNIMILKKMIKSQKIKIAKEFQV